MAIGSDKFLKKTLGDDFLESLAKVELWKPGTRTTLDHEEIKTALKIVPRTMMALLIRELAPMKIGEHKDIKLPVGNSAILKVDKHERDVYSGTIDEDNKFVVDFKFRSLPGIGLVILSAFELYDVDMLNENKHPEGHPDMAQGADEKVQKLIDERLALHHLITSVVEQKIGQREAISQMMLMRLTEELHRQKEIHAEREAVKAHAEPAPAPVHVQVNEKKYPLKDFLDNRAKKKGDGFEIHMAKGETVDCPDCKKNIFDGKLFSGCICLGDDRDKKIYIKKTEQGINVRFGRGWDEENIEMLLDVLRKKHE